jgi:hypothetical protein
MKNCFKKSFVVCVIEIRRMLFKIFLLVMLVVFIYVIVVLILKFIEVYLYIYIYCEKLLLFLFFLKKSAFNLFFFYKIKITKK